MSRHNQDHLGLNEGRLMLLWYHKYHMSVDGGIVCTKVLKWVDIGPCVDNILVEEN